MSVFSNIFKIKELKSRIFFTLGLVFICRMISIVPTPGVDAKAITDFIRNITEETGGGFMGMFDVFNGGALSNCSVGMLSIWPYISASIIIQLMTAIIPSLERMAREGDVGRQKLNQTTRYLTLVLCAVQAYFLAAMLENPANLGMEGVRIVLVPGLAFRILTVITVTAATMLTMWLGEQITERGVGNGTSIIIMVNIIAGLPQAVYQCALKFIPIGGQPAEYNIFYLVFILALAFAVFAATIALTQGVRRVPIHTARRSAGAAMGSGMNAAYMPLRVNFGGVMPIIFAGPIIQALGWVLSLINVEKFGWLGWLQSFGVSMKEGHNWLFMIVYSVLIIFFSFFWVATQFHAVRIADDLKNSGGYIPGIRPGMPTAEFLDLTMTRVTLIGAVGLVVIAVLPQILQQGAGIPVGMARYFGGTSLLIIVGVALDAMRQIESYLVMRNYDGFLKHGHIRGRR